MKDFLKKWYLTIGVVILFIILLLNQQNTISNYKNKLSMKDNLITALTDTLKTYKDDNDRLVHEKLTLQATISDLEGENIVLTENQKSLIDEVKKLNKKNKVISAALYETNVRIKNLEDSLNHINIDTLNRTVSFTNTEGKFLQYKIEIMNVIPYSDLTPQLFIEELFMPNKQFIEFHWNSDKKKNYPVSFSVRNTNPYFEIINVDSYIIPEVNKSDLNPNFWNKMGNFVNKGGNKILIFGAGIVIGAVLIN